MPATAEVLPNLYLPSSLELPSSDNTPVDNEDQNFIPNFLLFLLENIWIKRQDWYFGIDMGVWSCRQYLSIFLSHMPKPTFRPPPLKN